MRKNVAEAINALTKKPIFATAAERFLILERIKNDYADMPQPTRFAKFLDTLLSEVSVPIEAHDIIAGRVVHRELTPDEEARFWQFIDSPDNPRKTVLFGTGHCTLSWARVVELGLDGMQNDVRARMQNERDADRSVFLQAMLDILLTIERFMLRYADAADKAGLPAVAKTLRDATKKPRDFKTAIQLLWIIAFINCAYITENPTLTLGRLDRILYPLYTNDIQNGTLTRESARDIITDYYCKHNLIMGRGEHQVGDRTNSSTFSRIPGFDDPRYLNICGDEINELSELFAECIVPQFKNPVVVVRYTKELAGTKTWNIICQKLLASSSMMVYNDKNMVDTYMRLGLPACDAKRYEHFGCNWSSPGDNSSWMQGGPRSVRYNVYKDDSERRDLDRPYMRTSMPHSWPEDVMTVLRELQHTAFTIDDIYDRFFDRMDEFIDKKLSYLSRELAARQRKPSAVITYGDCFFEDSVKNAECFSATAKYHFELHSFQMFGTVCDIITAVDKLVLIDKKLTLSQLLRAVDADFEGYPEILELCRSAPKYGQNEPLSNMHVARLSKRAGDMVVQKNKPYFEKQRLFLIPCMQSDTWHYQLGITYGATPDGRRAGQPFTQNMRPANGVCTNGLTSMLNSMLNIPADSLVAGSLNFDIDKKQFEGKADIFSALLTSYFNRGGFHAQVTCIDKDRLRQAQKDPDSHRDILVRVTGYSAVFVDMPEGLQNDIIERMR